MNIYGEMQFMSSAPPVMDSGEYRVRAAQKVTLPESDTLQGEPLYFYAGEQRFTMEREVVSDVYPPKNSMSDYGTVLPHIVLKKKSYPWERLINAKKTLRQGEHITGNRTPWVALLLLEEGEAEVKTITLEELLKEKETIFFPQAGSERMVGEKEADVCQVLELAPKVFREVVPREVELEWLAHVRIVDLHAREENRISHPGCYSVVVCSRFPPASETAIKCSAHLVSLEGFHGFLPGDMGVEEGKESWAQKECIRLVSLHQWEFCSKKRTTEDFRTLAEKLDTEAFRLPVTPLKGKAAEGDFKVHALERLKRGYTVLSHLVRTGEKTASWYRGPLIPCEKELSDQSQNQSADGRLMYDRETGLFDMSYAAAWQLGRLMILKNRSVSAALCSWRKLVEQKGREALEVHILKNHLGELHKNANTESASSGRYAKQRIYELLADGEIESLLGRAKEEKGHEILDGFEEGV
ncbi:MAG: hypothetical protein PHW34_00885 [Hespellia sp.]|nr:hypothetical protein [Hespellia sp.]